MRRPLTVGIAAASATLLSAGVATAAWMAAGDGTGSAQARSLTAPSGVTASASGQTVTVNWTNGSNPAGTTTAVTRSGSDTALTGCGVTSCTDSSVPAGSYTYTVKHKLSSWERATTSGTVNVTSGLTTPTLTLTQAGNKTAGAAFSLTFDSGDPSITGSRTIAVSGLSGTSSHEPTVPTSATFANGSATVSVTAVAAETATISVAVGSPARTASTSATVVAAAAAKLAFVDCSKPTTANDDCSGQPIAIGNNTSMTAAVHVQDAYGNGVPAGSGGRTVTVTRTSTDAYFGPASATLSIASGSTRSGIVTLTTGTGQNATSGVFDATSVGLTRATLQVKR